MTSSSTTTSIVPASAQKNGATRRGGIHPPEPRAGRCAHSRRASALEPGSSVPGQSGLIGTPAHGRPGRPALVPEPTPAGMSCGQNRSRSNGAAMTTRTEPTTPRVPGTPRSRRLDLLALSGVAMTLVAFAATAPADPSDTSAAGLREHLSQSAGAWQTYAMLMAVSGAVLVVFTSHLRSVL